jgi:lysozyme family protein
MAGANLFAEAVAFTLSQEGGWADNPADHGGPTMDGITLAIYRAWLHDPSATLEQLRVIGSDEVRAIYRQLYWSPISGDLLQPGIGLAVFDAAVNLGVQEAAKLFQVCVGATRDGVIGPMTVSQSSCMSSALLIRRYSREREAYYRRCAGFAEFGRGWLARSQACFEAAWRIAGLSRSMSLGRPPVVGTRHQL